MMKKIVGTIVRILDGKPMDCPDAPNYDSAVRNEDGTWTVEVPDEK